MAIPAPPGDTSISIAKRILNEIDSKKINQRNIRRVDKEKKLDPNFFDYSDMIFKCECDDNNCKETISLPTPVYNRAHNTPHRFIVKNSHVKTDIEKVVERYNSYAVVEKPFMETNKVELEDARSKKRREENEVVFRQRNDAVKDIVKTIIPSPKEDFSILFTCECSNEDCDQNIEMTISDYELLRKNRREFIVKAGHEQIDIEQVVRHNGFNVVEKFNEPPKTDGVLKNTQ